MGISLFLTLMNYHPSPMPKQNATTIILYTKLFIGIQNRNEYDKYSSVVSRDSSHQSFDILNIEKPFKLTVK